MGVDWGSWQPFGAPKGSRCSSKSWGGRGRAVFALGREREKLFLFRFPPAKSPGRELAACPGGPAGPWRWP